MRGLVEHPQVPVLESTRRDPTWSVAAPATVLSVGIVSWNTKDLLLDCLGSVFRASKTLAGEVIVVDNDSRDGSPAAVATQFPGAKLIRNRRNRGFAPATNQVLRIAGGTYVLLLNSDTLLRSPSVLVEWVAFMDGHADVGASGCRLTFEDGRHQVGDAGFRPSLATLVNHALLLTRLSKNRLHGVYVSDVATRAPLDVDWVSGAATMVRRSILGSTGLLDEDAPMYAEDVEWGCRIREAGHRVVYLPGMEIVHHQGASSAAVGSAGAVSRWLVSLQRLYSRYHPRQPPWLFSLVMSLGFGLRFVARSGCFLVRRGRRERDELTRLLAWLGHTTSLGRR